MGDVVTLEKTVFNLHFESVSGSLSVYGEIVFGGVVEYDSISLVVFFDSVAMLVDHLTDFSVYGELDAVEDQLVELDGSSSFSGGLDLLREFLGDLVIEFDFAVKVVFGVDAVVDVDRRLSFSAATESGPVCAHLVVADVLGVNA